MGTVLSSTTRAKMKLQLVVALCLMAVVAARDNYFERYGYNKVMLSCFGPYVYKEHLEEIVAAEEECRGETMSIGDLPDDGGPTPQEDTAEGSGTGKSLYPYGPLPAYQHGVDLSHQSTVYNPGYKLHHHQAYSGYHHYLQDSGFVGEASMLENSLEKLNSAVGNFTCVLKKRGFVDDNMDILLNNIFKTVYKSVFDVYLKQDLVAGLYQCSYLLQCLPEDRVGSAFPYKLQRLLAFHKCERKARMTACLKQDLRKNIQNFDTSVLPDDGGRTGELEKLLTIIVGVEATED